MTRTTFHGRRAASIENGLLRVTVLEEGGHIAEIFHKGRGVSPLWVPPWPSIEPSAYDPAAHPGYGDGVDARLLAGIMGHNLCLDVFGGPRRKRPRPVWECMAKARSRSTRSRRGGRRPRDEREPAACGIAFRAAARSGWRDRAHFHEAVENLSRHRPAGRLDAARHARAAVLEEWRDRVPRVGHPVQSLRRRVRHGRLPRTPPPSSSGRSRRRRTVLPRTCACSTRPRPPAPSPRI